MYKEDTNHVQFMTQKVQKKYIENTKTVQRR